MSEDNVSILQASLDFFKKIKIFKSGKTQTPDLPKYTFYISPYFQILVLEWLLKFYYFLTNLIIENMLLIL